MSRDVYNMSSFEDDIYNFIFFYRFSKMLENTEVSQDIMHTNYDNAVFCWDSLLDAQTNLLLPFELQFFHASKDWARAQNVLDAGCGNGFYLTELRNFFPEKNFTGIDISHDLVSIAINNYPDKAITFEEADFFKHEPSQKYDTILMRLIVQHMTCLDEIFDHAAKIMQPNGSLIIIEPEPRQLLNIPPTPIFLELINEIPKAAAKQNKNRSSLDQLGNNLKEIVGWNIAEDELIKVPQIGPFANSNLMQMYLLWIDIFDNAKAFPFDYDKARDELEVWSQLETAYSQIALRIFQMKRKLQPN